MPVGPVGEFGGGIGGGSGGGGSGVSSVTALDTSLAITPTPGGFTATAGTIDEIIAAHTQGAIGTLISQLNGATTRTSSASAVAGEQTVLTGSTASQTLTLPASTAQASSPNLITNLSTQIWTIAAGAGTTQNRFGATASCNLVPGSFIEYILIGTVWYMIRYSLAPPQTFLTGTPTWTPSGTGNAIFAALVVGGGGGGGTPSGAAGGGGGGGGEVLPWYLLGNVTAGQMVTIGAGGTATNAGNQTSIGALVIAAPGLSAGATASGGRGGDNTVGITATEGARTSVGQVGGSGGGIGVAATAGSAGGGGYGRYGAGGGAGGGLNGVGGNGGGSAGSAGGTAATNAGGGGGAPGGTTTSAANGSGTTGGVGVGAGANTGGGGGGGGAGSVTDSAGGPGGSGIAIVFQVA